MSWPEIVAHLGIFVFAAFLDAAWVLAVYSVGSGDKLKLVLVTGAMQFASFMMTKVIVADDWTMISGCLGAMTGAVIGIYLKPKVSQTNDPRRKIGFQSSSPSSDDE